MKNTQTTQTEPTQPKREHSRVQLNRLLYFLERAPRIGILSHRKADGDTLGAQLALAHGFRAQGKSVYCANLDEIPRKLKFLPGVETIEHPRTKEEMERFLSCCDLFVTVDTGAFSLTGLQELNISPRDIKIPFLNIDHHPDNGRYGLVNIIIPDASSTAEIVGHVLDALQIPLTSHIGTCLLLGIFNDTDSFKNANVSSATLELTSRLIEAGADLPAIISNFLRDKTLNVMQLWGEILSRVHENRELGIVSAVVTHEDIERYKATPEDLEGIQNFINSVPQAKAALLLTEREPGIIKGSFRTLHDNIDVSQLARLMGGGGHKKAAGFAVEGRLVRDGAKWYIRDAVTPKRVAHASH